MFINFPTSINIKVIDLDNISIPDEKKGNELIIIPQEIYKIKAIGRQKARTVISLNSNNRNMHNISQNASLDKTSFESTIKKSKNPA